MMKTIFHYKDKTYTSIVTNGEVMVKKITMDWEEELELLVSSAADQLSEEERDALFEEKMRLSHTDQ
jgi:hypothetical protein